MYSNTSTCAVKNAFCQACLTLASGHLSILLHVIMMIPKVLEWLSMLLIRWGVVHARGLLARGVLTQIIATRRFGLGSGSASTYRRNMKDSQAQPR